MRTNAKTIARLQEERERAHITEEFIEPLHGTRAKQKLYRVHTGGEHTWR